MTELEKTGARRVIVGVAIMLVSLAVFYLGGAFAPSPELVNPTGERWGFVVLLLGLFVDGSGLACLNEAEQIILTANSEGSIR